ncbi:hypothetical protein ACF1GT_14525 [Streptomyces sp. NPDC014636]|uniref:hypothetical protein n=1 Tax=Streptomyces sp. NPDC014636 TaxID=3364876 RepID=UPI0036FDFBD7
MPTTVTAKGSAAGPAAALTHNRPDLTDLFLGHAPAPPRRLTDTLPASASASDRTPQPAELSGDTGSRDRVRQTPVPDTAHPAGPSRAGLVRCVTAAEGASV